MNRFAIASNNVPYAKILAREKKLNATFTPAPYGKGETMTVNMTRGQFKKFLHEVFLFRNREERKLSCPILTKEEIYSGRIKTLKMRDLRDGRKGTCFRVEKKVFA